MSDGTSVSGEHREYVDIKKIHPDWCRHHCWNCDHWWWVRRPNDKRVCENCFMGQDPEDPIDYGELWYGDVSIEEKRAEWEKTKEETRQNLRRGNNREVRVS